MRAKRRYMHGKRLRRSPIKNTNEITKTISKKAVTKGVTETIKKLGTRSLATFASGAGAMFGTAGAAWEIFKGYGDLAKQPHGEQIIKDSGIGASGSKI
mgnify:CR=1 FL=1